MNKLKTEGIKYAGSKLKLIPHIIEMASGLKDVESVLDGFSGSTRVSQAFAQKAYRVSSNDVSVWSQVFATCYLKANNNSDYYLELINHLNAIAPKAGWFTQIYGGSENEAKKLFQLKNAMKLDAIRDEIDNLDLSWEDKCVVLTSLMLALDKVDNTLGHYAAYLAEWSPRSFKDLKLKLPARYTFEVEHEVIKGDVFEAVKNRFYDLVYFDPPYGSNNEKMPTSRVRYAAYYHIWSTIINNDRPETFGKAFRRVDTHDKISASVFEEFRKNKNGDFLAMEALQNLIQQTNSHYLMLSYSSGGRATKQQLLDILSSNGKLLEIKKIDFCRNVMSNMRSTNEWIKEEDDHQEYIFLLEK